MRPIGGRRMSERARACALNILSSTTPTVTNETATIVFVCCCFLFRLCDTFCVLENIGAHLTCFLTHQLKCAHIFHRSYVSFAREVYCMIYGLWKWLWVPFFRNSIDIFNAITLGIRICKGTVKGQHAVLCDENAKKKLVNKLCHCEHSFNKFIISPRICRILKEKYLR